MELRFPRPLSQGMAIGVTSLSSGVSDALQPRLTVAIKAVEDRGYRVRVGACMNGEGVVSAPAEQRAA